MSMLWFYIITITIFVYNVECDLTFKQERAKLLYMNPKYAANVSILTSRENRHSPYLTSINTTSLVPIGDNFTFSFEFVNQKLQTAFPLRFDFKVCEAIKIKWVKEWLQSYSDIPLICPVPPASYHLTKFELPPRNFPYQIGTMDYYGKLNVFLTNTKERMCEIGIHLKGSKKP